MKNSHIPLLAFLFFLFFFSKEPPRPVTNMKEEKYQHLPKRRYVSRFSAQKRFHFNILYNKFNLSEYNGHWTEWRKHKNWSCQVRTCCTTANIISTYIFCWNASDPDMAVKSILMPCWFFALLTGSYWTAWWRTLQQFVWQQNYFNFTGKFVSGKL